MSKTLMIAGLLILVAHGLIHLMGTLVYMQFAEIPGFTYKTTLLRGRWDLGDAGIHLFGALWALATVGFLAAAAACAGGSTWWQPVLLVSAVFSLFLTILDFNIAFMGAIVNIGILVVVWVRK